MSEEWVWYHDLLRALPERVPSLWGNPDFALKDLRDNTFDVVEFIDYWFKTFGPYKFPKFKLTEEKHLPTRYKKHDTEKFAMNVYRSSSMFVFSRLERGNRGNPLLVMEEHSARKVVVVGTTLVLNFMLFKAPYLEKTISPEIPKVVEPAIADGLGSILSKRRERACVLI